MAEYDSREDTLKHIARVQDLLLDVKDNLMERSLKHDQSKLESPEKEIFDVVTPRLKGLTYGSDKYKAQFKEMGVALEHHYAKNSHHPEAHPDGVAGMTLLDLIECLVDWRAATERHANGSLAKSLVINKTRFEIDDQLARILHNTAVELKILDVPKGHCVLEKLPKMSEEEARAVRPGCKEEPKMNKTCETCVGCELEDKTTTNCDKHITREEKKMETSKPDKHDEEGNLIEEENDKEPIRRVVKACGQCHSIDGMRECSYWSYITSPQNTERDRHRCLLFGGVDKHATQSLVCCDKIYGLDYQGRA